MNPVRARRVTLAAGIVGAVLVALDGTVLTVAQPALRRDFDASFVQVQWTTTGYLIAVASLLVLSGRLGDRYGHSRVFALGVLGFGLTSAAVGLAPDIGWAVALRVVQGVFGALMQPATLGMLRAAYPPDRLGMPIALRTSAIGAAAALGPLLGGVLVAEFGWRSVFYVNVVPALAAGAFVLSARLPSRTTDVRLDLPGAGLLAVTLVCLVHTLVALPEYGVTAASVLGLLAATGACWAFVRHERRTAEPLVPPGVFRSTVLTSALGTLVAVSAALFGTLFLITYYLQDVLGLNPLHGSLHALPLAVAMVAGAPVCAVLLRRYGPRGTVTTGALLVALAVLLMSRLGPASGPVGIGGCFLLLGAGFVAVMVTATAVLVREAPVESAGVTGGLQQTAMNVGPMLGVAVATTLASSDGSRRAAALVVLAVAALLGALLGRRLPARGSSGGGSAGGGAGRDPRRGSAAGDPHRGSGAPAGRG
ncbi:MFS transporter [Streptomyces fructofermentans]|uniref:MFS transporter n=1 Tax=Streptomyces fructofermentans TaxID=152141 RepID=A0A918NBQ7_9ACTN|nr:MFS transporter [Streptomyces fructofermentans]GGX56807.1 MFS transporter [Streptomyces fructofermentans]